MVEREGEVFREGGRICSLFAFVLSAKACGARGNGLMGKRERERERDRWWFMHLSGYILDMRAFVFSFF